MPTNSFFTISIKKTGDLDDAISTVEANPGSDFVLDFDAAKFISFGSPYDDLFFYRFAATVVQQVEPNATIRFDVYNAAELDEAIGLIDRNTAGRLLFYAGPPVPITDNYIINIKGEIDPLTINGGAHDLTALDNANAHVTIEGNNNILFGDDQVSGLRVLHGNVAINNLTFMGTIAKGGDGGQGLAGGG